MTEQQYKYYFACGFAYWAIHIFYRPFESAEDFELDALSDHIGKFHEHAENIADFMLEEVGEPGLDFIVNKEAVSMFGVVEASEPEAKAWIHQLINVMHAQQIEEKPKQWQYLYCLLIGWELYMIMIAQKYMNTQKPEGKEALQELINPYANFLLNEWDLACRKFLGITAEEMMKNDMARKAYEETAINWHRAVEGALKKYLKSELYDKR